MSSPAPQQRPSQLAPLDLYSSKWTIPVLLQLHREEARFGALHDRLAGISNKSLSAALRQLQRDGLVGRKIFGTIPPRVDYWLTPLGDELAQVLASVTALIEQQRPLIKAARREFDARGHTTVSPRSPGPSH
jgi:DNA-binding HxlR family transcriptional regulator